MSTSIGIGFSQNPSSSLAAREAATKAKIQTQQPAVDCALVFHTIHYRPSEVLESIREILGEAKLIGATTAGVILPESIEMRAVAVLAIQSSDLYFGCSGVPEGVSGDIRQAGNLLARRAMMDLGPHPRQGFVCFIDGLLKNSASIIKGFQEIFGTVFPIAGAGASDDFHFRKTYQYCQDKVMTGSACGLLIGGHGNFVITGRHGLRPLGKPRTADHAAGHIIKTIDGKKAFSLYEEFLGNEAQNLRSKTLAQMAALYPLGIFLEEEREYLLRNAVDILNDGSIVCQGEVPEGGEIHIMISSKDSMIQAALDCALEIREAFKGRSPQVVVIFESLARHKLLGQGGAFKEILMMKEILGNTTPILGMYSYGEMAPFHAPGPLKKIHLQHQSIVLWAIG